MSASASHGLNRHAQAINAESVTVKDKSVIVENETLPADRHSRPAPRSTAPHCGARACSESLTPDDEVRLKLRKPAFNEQTAVVFELV